MHIKQIEHSMNTKAVLGTRKRLENAAERKRFTTGTPYLPASGDTREASVLGVRSRCDDFGPHGDRDAAFDAVKGGGSTHTSESPTPRQQRYVSDFDTTGRRGTCARRAAAPMRGCPDDARLDHRPSM